jgi:hypothetical protein
MIGTTCNNLKLNNPVLLLVTVGSPTAACCRFIVARKNKVFCFLYFALRSEDLIEHWHKRLTNRI